MNLKAVVAGACLLSLLANSTYAQEKEQGREKYNFNYGWKLNVGDAEQAKLTNFDDNKWTNVNLPYAWNQAEAFKVDISHLPTGIAWYRKTFQLPKEAADKKVFIEFEGVRQMGEIYVNGTLVGLHENGAMAFGLDV